MTSPSGQIMRQFGQMENYIMLSLQENVFSTYCEEGCWVIIIREDLIYKLLDVWAMRVKELLSENLTWLIEGVRLCGCGLIDD